MTPAQCTDLLCSKIRCSIMEEDGSIGKIPLTTVKHSFFGPVLLLLRGELNFVSETTLFNQAECLWRTSSGCVRHCGQVICWFTHFVVSYRESHLRTFCRQVHQCAKIGGRGVKILRAPVGFYAMFIWTLLGRALNACQDVLGHLFGEKLSQFK